MAHLVAPLQVRLPGVGILGPGLHPYPLGASVGELLLVTATLGERPPPAAAAVPCAVSPPFTAFHRLRSMRCFAVVTSGSLKQRRAVGPRQAST